MFDDVYWGFHLNIVIIPNNSALLLCIPGKPWNDLHWFTLFNSPENCFGRRFIITDLCRLFKRYEVWSQEITYDIRVICIDVINYRWLDDPIYHIVLKSPFFLSGICWWCLACRILQILVGRKSVFFFPEGTGFCMFSPSRDWLGTLVNMALFGNWFHPNPEDKIMIFPYFPQSIGIWWFFWVYIALSIIRHSQFLWVSSWLYSFFFLTYMF